MKAAWKLRPSASRKTAPSPAPETLRSSRPAPLFFVALIFAAGVAIGDISFIPPAVWLLFVLAGLWIWLRRAEGSNDIRLFRAFLLFVAAAGAFHASVREQVIWPDDLRLLPESKFTDSAVWRGRIGGTPRFQARAARRGSNRVQFPLEVIAWQPPGSVTGSTSWQPARGTIQVRLKQAEESQFHYGDEVAITGALMVPPPPLNPGEFNAASWMNRHDIYCQMNATAADVHALGAGRVWPWMTAAAKSREWALRQLQLGLEDDPVARGILAGIVIGDIENIPPAIENAFRETNTFHIFAVSGQDVAVVLAVGLGALQAVGLLRWRWAWLLAPMLIMYCLLTGAQPSAVRAVVMALLVLTAWLCGRPVSTLNLWSMAALLTLAWNPHLIGNLSFQLSFGVVLALVLLTGPIFAWMRPLYAPDPLQLPEMRTSWERARDWTLRAIAALAASSLAAWIGSFPFMIYYFHQVSPIGLLANLVIVPLASLIVVIGAISLFASIFSSGLAVLLNNANWLFIKMMVAIVAGFAQLPWGNFFVPDFSVAWRPADPEFVCAEAGSTTAALIRYRGHAWLLETGDENSYRSVINPMRQFYGVNRFDGVILTELSARAAGGSALLAQSRLVKQWITPPWREGKKPSAFLETWRNELIQRHATATVWHQGDEFTFAPDFTVKVLAPFENEEARRAEDQALVLLFKYHGETLLWAGNISFGTEQRLLRAYPDLRADVLVEGKNRTEPNLSPDWLRLVAPREIILSATPFGHMRSRRDLMADWPADQSRPRICEQDETGTVTVSFRDDRIEIKPFLSAGK
jgi:competence protein ComEC